MPFLACYSDSGKYVHMMFRQRFVASVFTFGLSFCAANCQLAVSADERPGKPRELQAGAEVVQEAGKPDELKLEILQKEISGESYAVTGSGVVWTIAPEGPPRFHKGVRVPATKMLHLGYDDDLESITRPPARNQITFFDRGKWHVVPWTKPLSRRDNNGPKGRIVAGTDNVVLVVGRELTLLIRGTEVIDSGEFFDVILAHQDLIRRSFGLGVPHPIRRDNWRLTTMIAADSEGNIWCLNDRKLRVLVDGEWVESGELLVEKGKRHDRIAFLIPGPDHQYFYIGDQSLRHDGGMSFLAKIQDGNLSLEPTHHTIEGVSLYAAVREQNDAIWIGSPDGRAGSSSDSFHGQSAVRFDRNGDQTDRLRMSGYPVLSDPIGNMWLGQIRGSSRNHFNVLRDGKVVQKLDVPVGHAMDGHQHDRCPLFCDEPGSVYVYTVNGLQHMVADDKEPHVYRKGRCYSLGETSTTPRAYSKQGYCVWLVVGHDAPLKMMYLAKLPDHGQAKSPGQANSPGKAKSPRPTKSPGADQDSRQ